MTFFDFQVRLQDFGKSQACWDSAARWFTPAEWLVLHPEHTCIKGALGVLCAEGTFCHLLAYPWDGQEAFLKDLEVLEREHAVWHEMITCYAAAWYFTEKGTT